MRSCLVRVLVLLLVLVGVLVGADRIAAAVVADRLASTIASSQHLATPPRVTFHGFPFVTQVLRGRYDDVGLEAQGPITAKGIRVDDASARLRSVRVRLRDALNGTVPNAPVETGAGTAVVPYSSVNTAVRRYGGTAGAAVRVEPGGPGHARVVGPLGLSVTITAKIEHGQLIIMPRASDLDALPSLIKGPVASALTRPVPLPAFPFNVRLSGGSFERDGLRLRATSRDSVFPVR